MVQFRNKKDIRKLSLDELEYWIHSKKQPAYRARQIFQWLWKKGVGQFDQMSNLSKKLRTELEDHFEINRISIDASQMSRDGTIKSRFSLFDGNLIESVLIPLIKEKRFTVCVSTQVGCSLSCSFCATGKMKRMRNLEPGEIFDQVIHINQQCLDTYGEHITNIVYMGMGEPLLNYKNTLESIEKISLPQGLNISPRRITVSTAGIARMIRKLADEQVRFNLALSLHAADDLKRNEIMAINEQNNLSSLMAALTYFYEKTKNRISFEYIAFDRFNDNIEDAINLARLCRDFPVRVNVIEYNAVEGVNFTKSGEDRLDRFIQYLVSKNVRVTVRRSRGKDIDAACGQLANKEVAGQEMS